MSDQANIPVLACSGLSKIYPQGRSEVRVLENINLEVARGEIVAIIGSSGSGKSTLLHLLGGLDAPTAGDVRVQGRAMQSLSETERGSLRNSALGFVYQFHHLLGEFSALENVAMPLLIRRMPRDEAHAAAKAVLTDVGLAERLTHTPGELSGGPGSGAGHPARLRARRRAHRQPRPPERTDGVWFDDPAQPRARHQPDHGHPRRRTRAPCRPRPALAGRGVAGSVNSMPMSGKPRQARLSSRCCRQRRRHQDVRDSPGYSALIPAALAIREKRAISLLM